MKSSGEEPHGLPPPYLPGTAGGARGLPRRILRRLGRRGGVLLALAYIDAVIAWSLIDPQTQAQATMLPAYKAMIAIWKPLTGDDAWALGVWGLIWMTAVAVCASFAWLRRDWPGYATAIGIKVVWAGSFAASWIFWDAPRAWIGASTWAVLAALIGIIAGWRENVRVARLP